VVFGCDPISSRVAPCPGMALFFLVYVFFLPTSNPPYVHRIPPTASAGFSASISSHAGGPLFTQSSGEDSESNTLFPFFPDEMIFVVVF